MREMNQKTDKFKEVVLYNKSNKLDKFLTSLLKQIEKTQIDNILKYKNSMHNSRVINLKLLK